MTSLPITFDKDYKENKMIIRFHFNASLDVIWDAFTSPEILGRWFAPAPYQAVTKIMEFKEGGRWLYYMLSPEGEKFWSTSVFSDIRTNKSFEASDAFCDENGVINPNYPKMMWHYDFVEEKGKIFVTAIISFTNEEEMQQLLKMGFEEGYTIGLNQLQKLLE